MAKVFISYSHDSAEHSERVIRFADALRSHGIDAEIDKYHQRPPQGWPAWCEEQLRPEVSSHVLMICTQTYHDRVQNQAAGDEGRGVFWEARFIHPYVYESKHNERFIPVLFDGMTEEHIPVPMRHASHYRISKFDLTDPGYESLYRDLTGQPYVTKPDLGTIVPIPSRQPPTSDPDELSMPDQVPTVPSDLIRAFADNEVVLYAGAGLSHEAGFPLWKEFVESLVKVAGLGRAMDISFLESLDEALSLGESDFVADSVVSALRDKQPSDLEEHLRLVFQRTDRRPSPIHRELRKLNFRAAMTTNFDELLEETFASRHPRVYEPRDTEKLLDSISKREFFILKLYGRVDSPDVLVAPAQYEEAIRGNRAFASVIETLFFSTTILFLGASLEGIQAYLRGISLPGVQKRTHYALVAVSGKAWRTSADILRRRYGIEVLPIHNRGHIGGRVLSFVEQLTPHASRPLVEPSAQSRTITRVALQNIGPFTSLELALDERWNVLLGDNGVGKSSILRAIATALIGPRAPHAERLIKEGEQRAEIAIDIGKTSYKTELFRSAGSRVELVSHLSPIEAEGVLAIGFPALRTVSWNRPKSPMVDESARRPTASDLAPLAAGGLDPRTDDLKQWIVSIDYRARSASQAGPNSADQVMRNKKAADDDIVLRTFFRIIGNITEGMTLEFDGVDSRTYDVRVRTADGPLPIEALSQGTISLLSWIGLFVQRLGEVFEGDEIPLTERPAIVLVDEIDAHLHPAWQQILVNRLSDEFPNVQFIATTHSPLIVGGMQASQVFRFERDTEGKVEQVVVENEMTVGRADQILTSELFGLETTLDTETLKARDEYSELLGRRKRNSQQEERLRELEDILGFRIPASFQTPVERQAYQLLEALLRRSVGERNADMQAKVLNAGRKLLDMLAKQQNTPSRTERDKPSVHDPR